jgi:hypothetical protein
MSERSDNIRHPESSHPMDELLRHQLEADATTLATDSLRARVMASLALDSEVSSGEPSNVKSHTEEQLSEGLHRRWYSKAGALIVAAGLLIAAFLAGRFDNVAFASASDVLRAAKATHAGPIERVYVSNSERCPCPCAG